MQSLPLCLPIGFTGCFVIPAAAGIVAEGNNDIAIMLDARQVVAGEVAAGWGMLFRYFYSVWLLIHREGRDSRACAEKYSVDWAEYVARVPWKIIPGIY